MRLFKTAGKVLVLLGLFLCAGQQLIAQSTAQTNIVGIPPVLTTPFADDIEQNFVTGKYQVIFNYSSFSSQPVDFVFEFTLIRNNRALIELESLPKAFTPGSYVFTSFFEDIDFRETPEEVVGMLESDLRNQIAQSGAIPEGNYSIEITARPLTDQTGINSMTGRSFFSVRYPPPPILVSIPDGSNVMVETPTFAWTPVVSSMGGMFDYEFLLVEVFEGQTPLQAINGNREHAFVTLSGQTTLPYTLQYLPLEEGATYAWQVMARDAAGEMPLQNGGESEIYTFTYRSEAVQESVASLDDLQEIPLIPGFATLADLDQLQVTDSGDSYLLNGVANLVLEFDAMESAETSVAVNDLRIQKQSLTNPILMGGSIAGNSPDLSIFTGESDTFVDLDEISWQFGKGLSISVNLISREGEPLYSDGKLSLQSSGLSGSIVAEAEADNYLARFGEDPFELLMHSIQVHYPGGQVTSMGRARVFGEYLCDVPELSVGDENFTAYLDCNLDESISLVENSDYLKLTLNDLNGQFTGSWFEDQYEYAASIRSDFGLKLNGTEGLDEYCGASGRIKLSDQDGLEVDSFQSDCIYPDPTLDLGVLNLGFQNSELVSLERTDNGSWDFDFRFDAELFLSSDSDMRMPQLSDVSITSDGIHFPEVSFSEDILQPGMMVDLDPFRLALKSFNLENTNYPWFEWDETGPGPWDFVLDAGVHFPDSEEYPACLQNATMELTDAGVAGQSVTGDLQMAGIGNCRWEFGAGYALDIDQVDGFLHIDYEEGELNPEGDLSLNGTVELGQPFACGGSTGEVAVDDIQFLATENGISADIDPLIPDCPIQIGPYLAEISESKLSISHLSGGELEAELSATASLDMGGGQSATGTFSLNLVTGEFNELDFDLQGPFEWSIPKEDSVLVFEIDRAGLSEEGIFIDGRQTLLLDGDTMGVTFDELLVDWQTFEVKSGRMILDNQFSFEAGIDPNSMEMDYSVTMRDSMLTYSPGVLFTLAGTVTLDTLGLHTSGTASGELKFGDVALDELEVVYTDDFAMRLAPFGVSRGQADLYWEDQRIAMIDETGFTPDIGFFGDQFLPDRIPLPTEQIAYLQIRENDQLSVQTTRQEDGSFLIETLQGQPLKLYVPALQGTQPDVPNLDVTLDSLLVNPTTGNYISGTVTATVPEGSSEFDLEPLGIPLTLNEIVYATQNFNSNGFSALFLNGDLTLMDQQIGESGQATLFLESDGRVRGGVTIPDPDTQISLDPGSDMVVFDVDSLNGNVDIPVLSPGQPNFVFDLSGSFRINNFEGDQVASAGLGVRFEDQGFSVTEFDAAALSESVTMDTEYFSFTIDQISTLSLDYTEANGFDYFADLDFTIGMHLPNGETIEIPLKNVDIRTEHGFVIPEQDIHDGSNPALNAPEFDLGIFRMKPLAFRMERDTIDIHNFTTGDLLNLLPEVDLELTFPTYSQTAPSMAQQSLTLNGVGYSEGILTGSILPYTVPDDAILIPMGPAGLYIDQFSGSLFETAESEQGFDLQVSGHFGMPDPFTGNGGPCSDTRVDLNLTSEGGFVGTVNDFLPCGQLELGPLSLSFGTSILTLDFTDGEQEAVLDGTGTAEIDREGMSTISASGALEFDLLKGEILSGSIGLNDPFTWYLPADEPLFALNVQTAQLDSDGLKFTGGGSLDVGEGTVSTTFNNLAMSLRDGAVTSGNVEIHNQFAIDVEFNPTEWQIADPNEPVEFAAGVRFVMPPNLTLDQSGLTVDGQSSASLKYGSETYDALSLDFVNMALGVQPVGVTSGRADLLLDDEGTPTRLGWYDSDGFHADNLAGAVSVPDTLGLPTKDIAYLVLTDDQGQNLVQSQDVSGGLEIYTTQPVPLVLAGLEDSQGESPRVDVSFSDVTINDTYEIISGSISVDVSDTPLNLSNYGEIPISLTAIHFQKLQDEPYKLYADAGLTLPESLQDLEVIVEQLILGSGGFDDAVFSVGSYTTKHIEPDSTSLASHEFADGAFALAVQGVELEFGDTPSYKFSGDMNSSFITSAEGDTANVHFAAEYTSGNWDFNLDTDHITPQELPIGQAKLILDELGTEYTQSDFDLVLDGRFALSELTGDDLEIGIEGLRIGTSGVSVDQVNTDDLTPQSLSLFGQTDNFTIADLALDITQDNHLMLSLDGSFSFMDSSFGFNDFKLGTDGTFEIGGGNVNLINPNNPVELMDQYLVLTALQIGIDNGKASLTATGDATLPDPLSSTASIDITVDHQGSTTVNGPSFTLQNASAGLGDFADLNLTGVGLQIDDIHQSQLTLYASAEVDIDGEVIKFGEPGSPGTWGIRYGMSRQKLEWNITNTPNFSFDAGFFAMTISNVSLTDPAGETFGVSIDANAAFLLDGIGGAGLQLENFEISTAGIGSMGNVTGGGFEIAGAVSVEVGSFDWGQNEEITLVRQDGSDQEPGSVEESIMVDEFLRFGSQGNNAVNITIEGGFSGGIEEIFYYRNSESLYLNIEGVDVQFNDSASLFASLEYENQPDGFMLRVAGGGSIETDAGQSYGLSALGRMSTLNDEFSFGIFVSLEAEIPLFPGVITLTEVGGGFFYNATNDDFEDVVNLTDYEFYNDKTPWEDKSGDYDFAVALNAGASVIGMGGAYAVDGRTLILITDQWFAMDVQGELLGQGESLSAGMYLEVVWDPIVKISGSVTANVEIDMILSGGLDIDFFAVEDYENSTSDEMEVVWGIHGDGHLDIIGGIAEAEVGFMISKDGFYTEIFVEQGFDVWVISVSSSWEGSLWWVYGEQFGAYVEIGFDATLFKVASVGGTLKGALIVDSGYLVYASASAYVKVKWVYTGNVSVWVSMRNGNFNGGRNANSEYESLIDEMREEAKDMESSMNEALAAASDLENLPEVARVSEEDLTAAGENLLSAHPFFQGLYLQAMIINEENMVNNAPQIHEDIRDFIVQGESRPDESDYNIATLRSEMDQEITFLTAMAASAQQRLSETYELSLEWEQTADELLADPVENPVESVNMDRGEDDDTPISFQIDPDKAAANQSTLEELKRAIDNLDQQYMAAIDSVANYIQRVDEALETQVSTTNVSVGQMDPMTGQYELTGASFQAGANMVSEQYAEASRAIDKFYGNFISHRWRSYKWASERGSAFESLRSGSVKEAVISANEAMLEERSNMLTNVNFSDGAQVSIQTTPDVYQLSSAERQDMIDIAAERAYFIQLMNPNSNQQDANSAKSTTMSDMESYVNDEKLINFIIKGVEFWYDMPSLGYTSIRDSSKAQAERMVLNYRDRIEPMKVAHETFTETVDEIYKSKAALTMSLHGLVDVYAAQREDLAGDSAAVELNNYKNELQELLRPPTITNIQVSKNLAEYNNKVTLSWNAQHPTGKISENSYVMSPGTISSVFAQGLLSTGSDSEVTRYLFKESGNELDRDMRVVIRARGPSGTAISRPATFNASVDQFGSMQGTIESYFGSTETIGEEDTSPPSKPLVFLDYNKTETDRITYNPSSQMFDTSTETIYWTNQTEQIVFTTLSFDQESDISTFEYALGSVKGGTDIVDWTPAQGRRVTRNFSNISNMGGADNAAQEITIRNLSLNDSDHYLSVRATNGAGLVSAVEELGSKLRYDGDPPTSPAITDQDITMPNLNGYQSDFQWAVQSAPEYEDPPQVSKATPEVTIEWTSASDPESGIARYEYVISSDSESGTAFSNTEDIIETRSTEIDLVGDPLSFGEEFYIHVRALNNAGSYSEGVATYGPVKPKDPTRPWTPKIKASAKPDGIGVYMFRPSFDPESSIERYEYTVKPGLFSDNLFDWTELSTSSIGWDLFFYSLASTAGESMQGSTASYLGLPVNNIPEGESLVLGVRAVNRQGTVSGNGFSGMVTYDSSPPNNPSISLAYSNGTMEIDVSDIRDSESGIRKVEYRVQEIGSSGLVQNVIDWTDFITVNGVKKTTLSGSNSVSLLGRNYYDMKVTLRITNGNGMQTTVSKSPVYQFNQFNNQTYNFTY